MRDHSLLIDRYKYMDLLPCNNNELRSLGYTPVSLTMIIISSMLLSENSYLLFYFMLTHCFFKAFLFKVFSVATMR